MMLPGEGVTFHGMPMDGGGLAVLDPDVIEKPKLDDDDTDDYGGWFCVRMEPAPVCEGCGSVLNYICANAVGNWKHVIVVWPEDDDLAMLKLLSKAQKIQKANGSNRQYHIVEYEKSMGRAISWYKYEQIGGVGEIGKQYA